MQNQSTPESGDPTPPNTVFALAADMIFGAKIRGAAQASGTPIMLARNATHLIDLVTAADPAPYLILLDLDTRGLDITSAIGSLRSAAPAASIVAFVSHVNASAIAQARDAGAHRVVARSAFSATLPAILTQQP